MKYPSITIRLGANVNEVEVDGTPFNRYGMPYAKQNRLRKLTVIGWRKAHDHYQQSQRNQKQAR